VPEFPDIVRGTPEAVWRVLTDPRARSASGHFYTEAALEAGEPGTPDAVVLYRTRRQAWREVVLQAQPPERLLLERRDATTDRTRATLAWRIEPIELGSLVVLDVQGKGVAQVLLARYVHRRWYRRLVEAVKYAVEGPPTSRLGPEPPPSGLRGLLAGLVRRARAPEPPETPPPPRKATKKAKPKAAPKRKGARR
jgi:uncharacterized protein YndB with AHSA1/START domain